MPNFKSYDYNQSSMVVINFEDQLQPGTFEHAIHYLVGVWEYRREQGAESFQPSGSSEGSRSMAVVLHGP